MSLARVVLLCALTVATASCTRTSDPAPFRAVASVDELMDATIQPAASAYWGAISTTVTKEGIEEKFPRNDQEWEAVWAAAITISESGNLLMLAPRAKAGDREWLSLSQQLVNVGELAAKAAKEKSTDNVLTVGEQVYDVCTRCHMKYIVQDGGE
jgi:hypothetical protein